MTYELIENMDGQIVVCRTDADGVTSMFFADEDNPDYQQYLIDTDGGLPLPTEEEK